MFRGILFFILVLTFTDIHGQENEGLEEVWVCTVDYDEGYYSEDDVTENCRYSATPAPDPLGGETLFPDFSCHPGFSMRKMKTLFRRAMWAGPDTLGPNTPWEGDQPDCSTRFNVMIGDNHLDMMDQEDGDDDNFVSGNPKYTFRESSFKLADMLGDELADALMLKIKEECQPVFQRVFYEEKKLCHEPNDELYDCVNKAIGC